jgi:PAS domain S-box-containing protein
MADPTSRPAPPGPGDPELARLAVAAVESSGTAVAILDAEIRILHVNAAALRLWGYERAEEVLGRQATEFWRDSEAASAAVAAVMRDGRWAGELVARRADGTHASVRVHSNRFSDPVSGAVRVISTFDDVTERVRLEEQLRQAQKMEAVGALAGGVAHDFNNILTVILSLGAVMGDALPKDTQVRADLEELLATARRAEGLTRQILAFARRHVSDPVDLDLNATVAGATRLLERLIGEHIAVKLSLAPAIPCVHADPRLLEQILMNLAVNARDAMPGGGTLAISTFALPPTPGGAGRVELVVRDTGKGMDAETRARAFEPFFTTKPPGRGTGLGLAVVHGIVQQCGGTVSLDSAVGRGTVIRIVLPTCAGPAAPVEAAAPTPLPVPAPGRTILLVEDEERVRRIAARCLERVGYRVLPVADGEDALRLAASAGRIDLLLTDVVMPGLSGPRLAEKLCSARPGLPVLFMTGFSGEPSETLAMPPGSLLRKPFTPETLVARVAAAVAGAAPGPAAPSR